MFKNLLLKLLLLGLVVSLVIAEEKTEEKHDEKKDEHIEDEHDEDHEKITPKDHDEHEDDHDDKKDDDHHDDEHDDKKDDDHHDDDEHDDKKDDDDDDHEDKKDDDDHDDEGDHDDAKDDEDDESEDGNEGHPEHDAFLGDQLTAFQDLQDEEAKKKKLQELVANEVDTNKDGFVTEDEIRARLIHTTQQQRKHEMNSTMMTHDDNKDGKVSWEEFKKHHYTHEGEKTDDKDGPGGDKEQMEEDEAKFKQADVDGDGGLNLDEYISFYHPGDNERMSAFIIAHTLQKYDTDKDGALSQEEYTKSYKDLNDDAKAEIAKDFTNSYDANKDGKLDVKEMPRWLFPDEDMSREEPPAMMKEADDNKDGKLSMEEILKNYKVFVDDPPIGGEHDEL